jgi:hypothetical protein
MFSGRWERKPILASMRRGVPPMAPQVGHVAKFAGVANRTTLWD